MERYPWLIWFFCRSLSGIFYGSEYHKEAILILLDSLVQDPVTPDLSVFAAQVREKLSSLVMGHPPPSYLPA